MSREKKDVEQRKIILLMLINPCSLTSMCLTYQTGMKEVSILYFTNDAGYTSNLTVGFTVIGSLMAEILTINYGIWISIPTCTFLCLSRSRSCWLQAKPCPPPPWGSQDVFRSHGTHNPSSMSSWSCRNTFTRSHPGGFLTRCSDYHRAWTTGSRDSAYHTNQCSFRHTSGTRDCNVGRPTTLMRTETSQQLSEGLPWNLVRTLISPLMMNCNNWWSLNFPQKNVWSKLEQLWHLSWNILLNVCSRSHVKTSICTLVYKMEDFVLHFFCSMLPFPYNDLRYYSGTVQCVFMLHVLYWTCSPRTPGELPRGINMKLVHF